MTVFICFVCYGAGHYPPSGKCQPACLPACLPDGQGAELASTCGLSTPCPMLLSLGRACRSNHTSQKHCFSISWFPKPPEMFCQEPFPCHPGPVPLDSFGCLVSLCGPPTTPEPKLFALIQPAYPQPHLPSGVGCTLDPPGSWQLTGASSLTPFSHLSTSGSGLPRFALAPQPDTTQDPALSVRGKGRFHSRLPVLSGNLEEFLR